MIVGTLSGYGGRAYAACTIVGAGPQFECTGDATTNTTTQAINFNNADVYTAPGFGVDTTGTGGNAITITGDGAISYLDYNASPLTAADTALYIEATGDDGATQGSVTVNTNGVLQGDIGIEAQNYGSGALSITANGHVTGSVLAGIFAQNGSYFTPTGTSLSVTTSTDTMVSGGFFGVRAFSYGSGALTITANGDVTGQTNDGIYACHGIAFLTCGPGGAPITITVGAASTVTTNGAGADDFAIDIVGDPGNVTIAGTLNGAAGGAIQFDEVAALTDRLELHPTASINGTVFAGPGTDTLAFGGNGDGVFDLANINTQYQDFETFEVDSGVWTFSGTTTVPFSVNGGTMMGTGTFGGLTVNSGGVLAPGDSIGTMTVNGAFVLGPGAIFEVEVNAAGQSDKVIVNGTVNLTGSVLRVLAENGNYKLETEYLIIDNDGNDAVTGQFAQVTANLAFLVPSVDYAGGTGNDVVLTLMRNATLFSDVADTPNQRAVAGALDQFPTDNPLFLAVLNQTAAGARQAFDALSGEIHATVAGTLADDSRYVREAILGRLMQANYTGGGNTQMAALSTAGPQVASLDSHAMALGYNGKSLSAPAPQPLAFWTRAYGAWGDFDGDGNAATADRDLGGFVSGMDASVSGSWRAGLATGASFANVDVNDRYSSADVESYLLAAYTGGMAGPLALRGGGAFSWNDFDTSRAVVFPGFFERQTASYDADTGQIFGEVAYPTAMGGFALEPFACLAYVAIDTDTFRERGGALASLRGSTDQDVGYSTVGLRAATTMHWGSMLVTPHVSAAWQHAFDDVTPDAGLAFASTGIGFTVYGVPLAEDTALIDAGLDLALGENTTAGVSYSGQFGDHVTDTAVKGRLTWLF